MYLFNILHWIRLYFNRNKESPNSSGLKKVEMNFLLILKKLEEVHSWMTLENKISFIFLSQVVSIPMYISRSKMAAHF